eukprot:CAMPEP_0176454680 /NCGR_PEP_ID=MMETSP0127-20121128/30118_1 /TAXON_ID=938130 /ORGANISM="Platyophrya macrostoma, Strain WH" /LENGTH=295 /DNA_ID=CAMNT_0017844057 /DNA_START=105 /DNA_END=992 /DNA_ORIENTATION=-
MIPKNMLYSSKEIQNAKQLLKDFETGKLDRKVDSKTLWDAKYTVISNLHPDTGNEIFPLFKLSAFVPVNIPTAIGLNLIKPTFFNIVFYQTLNQSYNFGVNVSNANQSNASAQIKEYTFRYMLAVTSSVVVSLGAVALLKRTKFGQNEVFQRVGNYIGAATAGSLNLVASRFQDSSKGIILKDEESGEIFENMRSKQAGKTALIQGALSRSLIPLPVFIIPNIFQAIFMLPSGKISLILFNSALAGIALWVALPLSIGLFPQEGRIHYSKLEAQFHDLKNSKGEKVEYFVFNRGL